MRQTRRILFIAGLLAATAACNHSASEDFARGVAYYREDKFAKATGYFEKAVRGGTPTAQAWNLLGYCRLQTDNPAEAINAFQESLKLDPDYSPARYNLAMAFLESNQPEQAIPPLRQLAQAPHPAPSVYYQLGRAYITTGAWLPAKQALAHLHDAESSADIQNTLGVLEARLSNFKQAKTHLENAAHLDPNLPAVYLNLATLEHHYLNQKPVAVQYYQKFLDVLPKSEQREDIRQTIAQLTQDTVKPVEKPAPKPVEPTPAPPPKPIAAQDLPAVEKIEPKPAPVVAPVTPVALPKPVVKRRTPVSVGSLRAGDRAKAKAAFYEGIGQQQQGKPAAAVAAYGRAISADPTYAQAYYNLAIACVELRQPDKALDNYELSLAADPNYRDARYNYAILLQNQGYTVDALMQYEKILEKTPKDASLHLICASLYARDPNFKAKARQHYQAVQRLTPDTPAGRDAREWLQKNP